ncbi:MAG: amine oxidase, partial [Deltaproteobacteria bacterium]
DFGEGVAARQGGHIVLAPDLCYLERAYDDAKYGRFSENPLLDVVIPSLTDPSRVRGREQLLSVTMHYAPYRLREGHWDDLREVLAERVVAHLARHDPRLPEKILARHVITPLDFERDYLLTEGHIFQGQTDLDQLFVMRPVGGYGRYRTPVRGLYLCGAGAPPGGGVTGLPGFNASREILHDLRTQRG